MVRPLPGVTFWVMAAGGTTAFIAGGATALLGYWMLAPVIVAVLGLLAAAAWRRRSGNLVPLTSVKPDLVLIILPTLLGSFAISHVMGLFAISIVAIGIFWKTRSPSDRIKLTWPCAILPTIGLAIIWRWNYPNSVVNAVFFTIACIVIARAVYLSSSRWRALIALNDGVGLFLVASVALRFVGLGETSGRAVLGNLLTGGERVLFPLSTSLATTPAMAAVYLAGVTPIVITTRQHHVPRLIAIAAAVYIFVQSDRRSAMIAAVLLAACVLLAPRLFRWLAPWLTVAGLIIPFAYGFAQDMIERIALAAGTYFPWLSRSGEDLGTLGGRSYIWSQSINFYQDRIDWIHQMFGFGSFGVAASSASTTYSATFVGKLDRDLSLKSPHSSTLELLFDGGWVIGILFAATIVYMAWVLSRRTSAIDLAGLGMLTALSFVGIGEVTLSPGHAQATWWVLLILGTIAFSRESPCQPDTMKVPVNEAMPRTVQHL